MKQLHVLVAAYETAPFYKLGGLGDYMQSFPKALREIGVDSRIVMPYYRSIRDQNRADKIGEFSIKLESNGEKNISVYRAFFTNVHVPIYFLSHQEFLDIELLHGKNKRIELFAFFCFAASKFIYWLNEKDGFRTDLIHCQDWHTALIPFILQKKFHSHISTLLTIHNLNYQGQGTFGLLDKLGIPDAETLELKRQKPATTLNVLGEGFLHADTVSTVSPTYAKEISVIDHTDSPIGEYIKRRKSEYGEDDQLVGILNGIDYDVWNSEIDPFIALKFSRRNWQDGKTKNKQKMLADLGLADRPTICFIGRMAYQKGIDVIVKTGKLLLSLDANFIFLGQGVVEIEKAVSVLARTYSKNVRFIDKFTEDFAHILYASSDFILIPSHYEPCGLIQMIAMRYGTIPIASDTGGLHDSILNGKDGFLFKKNSSRRLVKTVKKALGVYEEKPRFGRMVERAMKKDFSWNKSAHLYKKLYQKILSQ